MAATIAPDHGRQGVAVAGLVKLNVGGTRFWTTRETLLWTPDTFFSKLLGGEFASAMDEEGALFVDRDPLPFRYILTFMRTTKLNLDDVTSVSLSMLRDEAEFYGISTLVDMLDFYLAGQDHGCGGILFSGSLNPAHDYAGNDTLSDQTAIRCIAADHNWIAFAFARRVVCYSFHEAMGWTQRYVSPLLTADIERIAIINKFGDQGSKMVAVAYGSIVRLLACSSEQSRAVETRPNMVGQNLDVTTGTGTLTGRRHAASDTFDLGLPIDHLFFIGSSLVMAASSGRVGVWNSVTKTWQVQDVAPIGCLDCAGTLLFLGSTGGSISYIDMEKFPLRLKDDALLVNDFWTDPRGEHITSLSVYMTGQIGDENCIEIAYGTAAGVIRIIIQHPQSGGHYPVLFQTYTVHQSAVHSIVLSATSLISVCKHEGHTRTWRITRFRGRISTQPGSVPLASFRISPTETVESIGPLGDRNQSQIFVQKASHQHAKTVLLDAVTGRKVSVIKSINASPITAFCVNECDYPNRLGARSRRFLLCGHEDGIVELWDLTTAVELFQQDRSSQDVKRMTRKPGLLIGTEPDHAIELMPSGLSST